MLSSQQRVAAHAPRNQKNNPAPPQTACTRGKVGIWTNFKLLKKDILSAQPARLYRAWMAEGTLLLSMLLRAFRFERVEGCDPMAAAHLTVRATDGIYLRITARAPLSEKGIC